MKSLVEIVEGMTDKAYVKNPEKYQEIIDQTEKLGEDIVKNMQDYCENDEQKSDYLHALLREIWLGMPKGERRKIMLPVLKEFI